MAEDETVVKERTITLTDAVVAIAMTLLVLPLIEAASDVDVDHVGTFLADNSGLFVGFVVSFLVIYTFWVEHRQIFGSTIATTGLFRLLNMLWLLAVAFIAFPTAVIGRQATTSTVPFYLAVVLALCVLTAAMSTLVARSADPAHSREARRHATGLWVSAGIVLACGLVGLVRPDLGLYGLLLIPLVSFVDGRLGRR